jgi:hypothetical protein
MTPAFRRTAPAPSLAVSAAAAVAAALTLAAFPALLSAQTPYSAAVTVEWDKPARPISEHIYGVAGGKPEDLKRWGVASVRWGGNRSSRFNWKLGVDSAAHDWFFMNGGKPLPPGAENPWLSAAKSNHAAGRDLYLTIPCLGWVAKDGTSWGFSVKKYGPQKAAEQWHPDAGNGLRPDGSPVAGNDPRDTSVEAPPGFIAEGVAPLAGLQGVGGRRVIYALDNEPTLWHSTHRDVHPVPVGYDELFDFAVRYGEAVRKADPKALIAGPATWGWMDLYWSAADSPKNGHADRKAHGGAPLVAWYLGKMAEHERKTGRRLLDILDVHFYPQAPNVFGGGKTDAKTAELRLRSTRSLWDPTYREESWISQVSPEPVRLIPLLKGWIAEKYPGTKLCLGEWNWGGADHASGALAAAEALGVFGREGVDYAYIWTTPEGTQRAAWDILRDYDGKGGRFGDRGLKAASDKPERLSAFAARAGDAGPWTVLLINKDLSDPATATVSVPAGTAGSPGSARAPAVFLWTSADGLKPAGPGAAEPAADGRSVAVRLPAASMAMLVLSPTTGR